MRMRSNSESFEHCSSTCYAKHEAGSDGQLDVGTCITFLMVS